MGGQMASSIMCSICGQKWHIEWKFGQSLSIDWRGWPRRFVGSATTSKKAQLAGGSPATPAGLRRRLESFLNERCKGKDASKLRFVVE